MKDWYEDSRIKRLAPQHQAKMIKALQDNEAADVYDDLSAELDDQRQLRRDLPKLMKSTLEAVQSAVARPVTVKAELKTPAKAKGTVRVPTTTEVMTLAISAEIARLRSHIEPKRFLEEVRPGDSNHRVRKLAMDAYKAATGVAGTARLGWAADLAATILGPEFRGQAHTAILPQIIDRGARLLDFKGQNAIVYPHRNRGTLPGVWVQEHSTIPVAEGNFGMATMNRYKMALIATLSEEVARVSHPDLVNVVMRSLLEDTAVALDGYFLDAEAPVPAVRPGGILNGVTPTASAGNSVDNVHADLKVLQAHLVSIRAKAPLLIINPLRVASLSLTTAPGTGVRPFQSELERGTLAGIPLVIADNAPADMVIAIDADSLFVGIDEPEFDTSRHATLVMLDTDDPAPKMGGGDGTVDEATSVNISDAATVAGGPAAVRSMYQTWSMAVRFVLPASWGHGRVGTVAALSGVDW